MQTLSKLFGGIITLLFIFTANQVQAQCRFDVGSQSWIQEGTDQPCANPVSTSLPFLTITPDARAGGLGDAGVALDPSAASIHHNASALAFAKDRINVSATYTPWLRNLVNDIYLAYLAGYYKIDENQAIGADIKFFNLGEIEFRDENNASLGTGLPREFTVGLTYARKLSDQFSMSVGGKYIYSNLAAGQTIGSDIQINAANSFAADIGMLYKLPINNNQNLNLGLAITNLGPKISYTNSSENEDVIPTNLAFGASYNIELDEYNSFTFVGQINKLLVPTPALDTLTLDANENGRADYLEQGLFEGIFNSFGDAPNGFAEEIREITWSLGVEYWYQKQFAVRVGYFNEHITKGNRKFITFGLGLRYNAFGMDLSYLVSSSAQRNPLANTLRFSFIFNMSDPTARE